MLGADGLKVRIALFSDSKKKGRHVLLFEVMDPKV